MKMVENTTASMAIDVRAPDAAWGMRDLSRVYDERVDLNNPRLRGEGF
jgi:hypothetical protein